MSDVGKRNMLDLIDELRAIAQTGLNHSTDPFDLQRYNRIRDLMTQEYASYSGLSTKEIEERFSKELGYITPKIGVQCAIFNDVEELLLEQRKDDGLWGLPAGWIEVGESPEEAITREIKEETNLDIKNLKFIGFYKRRPGEFQQPHASIHVLFLCGWWQGEVKKSFESVLMEFHDPSKIQRWHKDHQIQAVEACRQLQFVRDSKSSGKLN